MTELLLISTFVLSLAALVVALFSLQRAPIARTRELTRLVNALRADNVDLRDFVERIYKSVHKLRTRAGSEDARKKKEIETVEEDGEFDKDAIMRKFPQGALTPGRR